MTENILNQVRSSCCRVAQESKDVKICHEKLPGYAQQVIDMPIQTPTHDPDAHYLNRDEDTVAFFLTLDTINFGSGYFPHLKKLKGKSGYFTIATALKEYFEDHGPMTADQLMNISPDDCFRIFHQDRDSIPIGELMIHFSNALNELGKFLKEKFSGRFTNVLTAANGSAAQLVQILSQMKYFQDCAYYHHQNVYFFKRAQITVADLYIAFGGQSWGRFTDMDQLTIFADNLVPHVLKLDGILTYQDELCRRINSGELIPSQSDEEIEIRACAVHAVELLKEAVNQLGKNIASFQLDYILWNRGQKPYYKAMPRHRTRSVFY